MKTIKGNITEITSGIIFQQVNCQNRMGSGLAKSIYTKWPEVKRLYHEFCQDVNPLLLLGAYQAIEVTEVSLTSNVLVVNCFSQLNLGNDGQRYTDYGAIKMAFISFWDDFSQRINESQVYFPKNFGCGLGGGDWNIVKELIEFYFPDAIIVEFE